MLKEKLQQLIDQSAGKLTDEIKPVITSSMKEVVESIASRKIPKQGDMLPEFQLPDSQGNMQSSSELIGDGNLVISFFRGGW